MKVRNISDEVIEKTESGVTHVLAPGDEAPVDALINAEGWEKYHPGKTARVYEDGEYTPPIAPPGVFIVGVNHEGDHAANINAKGPAGRGAVDEGQDDVASEPTGTTEGEAVPLASLMDRSRDELNKLAIGVGIEDPKAYKTKGEIAEAIVANASSDPLYL